MSDDYETWSNEKLGDALDAIADRDAIVREAARRLRPGSIADKPNILIPPRANSSEEWERSANGDANAQ